MTSVREDHVEMAIFVFDGGEQPIEIGHVGHVSLHAQHGATSGFCGLIQGLLAATGDDDFGPFCGKQPGGR